jgi:hypothetical protein
MRFLPSFESLNRGFVVQGFLGQVFVIQPNVSMQNDLPPGSAVVGALRAWRQAALGAYANL